MMNKLVKENWVWLLSGIICLAAIIIFAMPVRAAMRAREELREELRQKRDELSQRAGRSHENERWINAVARMEEQVRSVRDDVARRVSDQRRNFHTRRFYESPYVPEGQRREIQDELRWQQRYEVSHQGLVEQARRVGVGELAQRTWSQGVLPRDEEIKDAMTLYWLQKDLIDILTNNEIELLDDILDHWGTREVSEPFHLLRNNAPGEPAETLLRLYNENRLDGEALRDIAVRILTEDAVDFGSADLRKILSEYRVVSEAGAEETTLWQLVNRITSSSAQRNILEMLERDGDWRHLYDYVMDIKTIRLRQALIDIFEASGEDYLAEVAEFLRNPTPEEGAAIRTLITRWEIGDVIKTLNAIIPVDNRETFGILVSRQGTPDITVTRFSIASISGRESVGGSDREGRRSANGDRPLETVGGIYHVIPIELDVNMEFEKLPLLMRRLFLSDWSISIRSINISRLDEARADTQPTERDPRETRGTRGRLIREPEPDVTEERPREDVWRRRVRVEMVCDARWFLPLKREIEQSAEGAASRR